jgi:hypothetical protein
LRQQASPRRLIEGWNAPRTEIIDQTDQAFLIETHTPFADTPKPGCPTGPQSLCWTPFTRPQDDAGVFHMTGLGFGLAFQLGTFQLG